MKPKKQKPRVRRELTFKFLLYLFTFGSHFCPPTFALPFFSWHLLFLKEKKRKENTKKEKP
jgi:hypothetical protein